MMFFFQSNRLCEATLDDTLRFISWLVSNYIGPEIYVGQKKPCEEMKNFVPKKAAVNMVITHKSRI